MFHCFIATIFLTGMANLKKNLVSKEGEGTIPKLGTSLLHPARVSFQLPPFHLLS